MSEPEALAMALFQSQVLAPSECVKCGAELSDREQERYISELRDWAQRHPGAWTDSLPGDLGNVASQHPYDKVLPDCDRCASERLLKNRKTQEATGFWDKGADAAKKGLRVVGVGLLIICVILKGCCVSSGDTM
jgi:DNA-directed RNA polymerase subunit RPC12/RpoP